MATRQLLGDVEFTHEWYSAFLRRLQKEGYCFRTFAHQPEAGNLYLRHDVDLSLEGALRMARLEADLGVQATYCILLRSPLYNPLDGDKREIVQAIESLGHDIALHFDTHSYWGPENKPDTATVERRVREEQEALALAGVDCSETVSFHRPPAWVLDREFESFQNTYAPAYFSEYVADSSQRWREQPPAFEEFPPSLQVLTHPGLWGESDREFDRRVEQSIVDSCQQTRQRVRQEFLQGEQK